MRSPVKPRRREAAQTALALVPEASVIPGAAFPDAVPHVATVDHLDDLEVRAAREERVVFDERADAFEGELVDAAFDVVDGVGVAHADEGELQRHTAGLERQVDDRAGAFDVRGEAGGIEIGRAHVHAAPIGRRPLRERVRA